MTGTRARLSSKLDGHLRGTLWMLLTGALFVAVIALVKLMGDRIPAQESAFLRYLLGLVFLAPMIRPMMQARVGARVHALMAARGLVHSVGVSMWFFAMTSIPIAEVTAMGYLAPIFVTVGAAIFLRERLAFRRIAAILVALCGAFVILRPGFRDVSAGHLAMLANGVMFGGSYLIAKMLADRTSAAVVVGGLSVWVTLGLAPFAIAVWVPPTAQEVAILFAVALFATAGHYTMTLAFAAAPVTVTQPVTYLQLLWSTLLGALAFGESIDPWVILGGTLVLGAVTFITWREAMLRRASITPPAPATKL